MTLLIGGLLVAVSFVGLVIVVAFLFMLICGYIQWKINKARDDELKKARKSMRVDR